LIYWKGAHLAIKAIAQTSDATLTLAGDGPSRRGLERLAARLGVSSRVTFVGQVSSAQVQALYERHDVLLFPSLQDSGGLVVLEAMAAALPVVCVNLGGPGLSVTPDTGIAVAPSNPELVVEELATALTALGADPQHRRSMGEAARRRVMEVYAWDQKGELMRTLYAECAGRSEPVFACQTAPEPTQ
jgi:glycosyltransferase involved in cell wall biosynthesis